MTAKALYCESLDSGTMQKSVLNGESGLMRLDMETQSAHLAREAMLNNIWRDIQGVFQEHGIKESSLPW